MRRSIPLVLAVTAVALAFSAVSAPTASAVECSTPPTITGTEAGGFARFNVQLTGENNCTFMVTGEESLEWFSCVDPSNDATCVSRATGTTYTPGTDDIGRFIKLVETATEGVFVASNSSATNRVKGRQPAANFTANPSPAKRNELIALDAGGPGGSSDPDGQVLTYAWDLDNDGDFDDATGATTSVSFPDFGTKTLRLRATDTDGDVGTRTRTVAVTPNAPPSATFVFSPSSPLIGTNVRFTSTASDVDGDPLSYAWDLDDDGAFDDGTTGVVNRVYTQARTYNVGLRVTADGETSESFRTVNVATPPATSPPPGRGDGGTPSRFRLLRPFPKVAIGGYITRRGVRLTLLGVRAPRGSRVRVKCRGRGCPRRTTRARVGRRRVKTFRSFRRRFRAGAVIGVYVWKKNRIGKYTRFRIRRGSRPARRDRCLHPTRLRPMRCP